MLDALRLAFGTLTVLPAGMPNRVDRTVAGRAMLLAPLAGLVIGLPAAGVVAAVHALRPDATLLAAVLGLTVLTVLSGALHLDGLADTADGTGSRRDREARLAIMRKSDIGPFGVVAIATVLLIDVAALAACLDSGIGWQAVLIAAVAGRMTLPVACRRAVPSARPDGLGAMVAGTVPAWLALGVTAVAAGACGVLMIPAEAVLAGAAAVVAAAVAGELVTQYSRRSLGGITGDVLGASVELGSAAALLVLTLAG